MTEGFDIGLEMSGNPVALRTMIDAMAHGGRIALLGIPAAEVTLDLNPVIFKMLTLKGIYGREMYESWYQMAVLVELGPRPRARSSRTASRYRDFEEAFAVARSGQSGKVILDWTRLEEELMYGTLRDDLVGTLAEVREAGHLQSRARDHNAPGRARRRVAAAASCSISARTTTSASPTIPRSWKPRTRRSTAGATAWPRSGSSAAPRRCTASSSSGCRRSSAPTTRSSSARASTPTAACSRRCSTRATPSSPTSSTTPRSSTGSGSAKRVGCATRTATWTSSRRGSRRRATPAAG